ncbi:YoaK family protein [Actinokineospora bangkokensis]|uniref:DUF1275 family protein n=1 Tax=Actinokineospora bangkokensis TaxID=1193682 RepID=A0A1Q9LL00_9PSEU|nr:YoaK family protein [Actinokineospora bangkokensis]OLR92659.1 hypothetical protein BJP25_21745 [Actinokineospora bangkokensis]
MTTTRGHGPLPHLLLVLTAATGVVDAVSILGLGRVFVANMTGNVVFVGFAIAGVPGFSLAASAAALLGFLVGSFLAGRAVGLAGGHRGRLLAGCAAAEVVLLAVALLLVSLSSGTPVLVGAAALLACAMGGQNAVVRALGVPDLTTTVLTMTLTGIAADVRGGDRAQAVRRLLAVLSMFGGAVVGALVVLHAALAWALLLALLLVLVVAVAAALAARGTAAWHHA